jgi:hypothetical protein
VSSVVTNVQLRQVQALLSGLQLLSGATLAASVEGVGVSAVGFALVLRRLGQHEQTVAAAGEEARAAHLAAERADVRLAAAQRALTDSLLSRAEEAFCRSDSVAVWRELEGPLDQAQRDWRTLVSGGVGPSIFLDPRFSLQEAAAAHEAVLVLAAARVQALLLIEEVAAALHHAREFACWHEGAVTALSPPDLAAARARPLAEAKGLSLEDAHAQLLRLAEDFKEAVWEAQLQAATLPGPRRRLAPPAPGRSRGGT